MEARRRLLMMPQSAIQPPNGYKFIEYAQSDGSATVSLPFGFYMTDELKVKASCGVTGGDRFLIAPSQWNDNYNRFAIVGGPNNSRFGVGFGGIPTTNTKCYWSNDIINRDTNVHIWEYKNLTFYLDDLSETLDMTGVTFITTTKNLKMFYGYNSNTAGKIYYYIHKTSDGTHNILPIQNKVTGEVEMYDTLTKSIMQRTGTLSAPT